MSCVRCAWISAFVYIVHIGSWVWHCHNELINIGITSWSSFSRMYERWKCIFSCFPALLFSLSARRLLQPWVFWTAEVSAHRLLQPWVFGNARVFCPNLHIGFCSHGSLYLLQYVTKILLITSVQDLTLWGFLMDCCEPLGMLDHLKVLNDYGTIGHLGVVGCKYFCCSS